MRKSNSMCTNSVFPKQQEEPPHIQKVPTVGHGLGEVPMVKMPTTFVLSSQFH